MIGISGKPFFVERLANGGDSAIHHVGWRDDVGPGFSMREGRAGQQLQGRIVLHLPPLHHAAVAVTGVFAQADVCDHQQVRHGVLDGPDRLLDDPILGVGL